jgi:hypothetical protein
LPAVPFDGFTPVKPSSCCATSSMCAPYDGTWSIWNVRSETANARA